jgi:hypothetical protein
MSLSQDVRVFREPGFLIAVALVVVLVGSVLLFAGISLDPRVSWDPRDGATPLPWSNLPDSAPAQP